MKKSVRIITNTANHVAGPNLSIFKNVLREFDISQGIKKGYRDMLVTDAMALEPPTVVCDINVHMDCINPAHFTTARTNVLMADLYWYSEHWNENMKQVDFVLTKTREAEKFFKDKGLCTFYIGWRGEDALRPSRANANFEGGQTSVLFEINSTPRAVAAANILINLWSTNMPHLHFAGKQSVLDMLDNKTLVNIHKHVVQITRDLDMESQELAELRNTCKTHFHVINGTGCPASAYLSLSTGARCIYLAGGTLAEILPTPYHLALPSCEIENTTNSCGILRKLECDSNEFMRLVKDFSDKPIVPRNQRIAYIDQVKKFRIDFSEAWRQIEDFAGTSRTLFDFVPTVELPAISIITPTYNRKLLFKLAIYSFLRMNYPRDRVQWIIVDDSDENECVKNDLPNGPITYIRLDKRTNLAEKRNIGVAAATNSIIIHQDDDDYYPPDSVRIRVSHLIKSGLDAVTCTTLPMYDLCRYSSAINTPPFWMSLAERCSEATFTYKKTFWEERHFDRDIAEGQTFLVGRLDRVKEISPAGIIISMLHSKNASSRGSILAGKEPNGSHYGFTNNFYSFLHSLEPMSVLVGGDATVVQPDPELLRENYGIRQL